MYSAMYQQPMVIQLTDEQLHQHCAIKEHKENTMNHAHREGHQNMHTLHGGYQHYHHNSNYKHNGKKQVWNNRNFSNRFGLNVGQNLPQSQEVLSHQLQYSHDSQTDSSCEDLIDANNKGIKLHEVNGHAQGLQAYPPHGPLQPRRSQSPQQVYQKPHQTKRHPGGKFGSPPHYRRNKPNNGTILAPDRYLARSHEVEVRDTPNQLVTGTQWDQLSTEIWHKFMATQQTTENYVNKMTLFKYLIRNIKNVLGYSVFVVGSTLNGFGTNTSDLDLCLVIRNVPMIDPRSDAIHHLFNTQNLLVTLNLAGSEFQNIELIEAKVPLLKFHHIIGVDVDVNFNNTVGVYNSHLLHCYAKADWRVQPLVLIVKLWANAHDINDAKNMTISSYSLALMVIHFLQCGVMPAVLPCLQHDYPEKFQPDREIHDVYIQEVLDLPPSLNTQSIGELLLQFLQYYNNFNFAEEAISVRLGTTLPVEQCRRFVSPKNEPRAWSHLCIEEPFDHTNTARAVYDQDKFEYIRRVFLASHQRLRDTHSLEAIFQFQVPT